LGRCQGRTHPSSEQARHRAVAPRRWQRVVGLHVNDVVARVAQCPRDRSLGSSSAQRWWQDASVPGSPLYGGTMLLAGPRWAIAQSGYSEGA
jgi:hypothetical protein